MTAWRRQGEIDIPQPNGGNAMQRNLIRLLAAALAVAGVTAAAAQEIDSVVKKLQATNSITVGYRETLLPTSYLDDQKRPTGYAIEMCMRILDEVKAELKLAQIKVDYVPVNIQNRQALVANGTVQLECGGTVNTFARTSRSSRTSTARSSRSPPAAAASPNSSTSSRPTSSTCASSTSTTTPPG
jgi:glutamate/aspartate transport system substrate-binding protein